MNRIVLRVSGRRADLDLGRSTLHGSVLIQLRIPIWRLIVFCHDDLLCNVDVPPSVNLLMNVNMNMAVTYITQFIVMLHFALCFFAFTDKTADDNSDDYYQDYSANHCSANNAC